MSAKHIIRISIALLITAVGVIFILLDLTEILGASQNASRFIEKIGIALTVAGVVSLFHEILLRRLEMDETARFISNYLKKKMDQEADSNIQKTVSHICNGLRENPIIPTGLHMVAEKRKKWKGYYSWVLDHGQTKLFFAGRSVLHRIDQDLYERDKRTAEAAIFRRLSEGATFRIMILDPRSELIPRLAKEEGQKEEELLHDIMISLGICKRLYELIRSSSTHSDAFLDIRFYDHVPYFAYHRDGDLSVVGFYFHASVGHSYGAYELVDPKSKRLFEHHFTELSARADDSVLVCKYPHLQNPKFDDELMEKFLKSIITK